MISKLNPEIFPRMALHTMKAFAMFYLFNLVLIVIAEKKILFRFRFPSFSRFLLRMIEKVKENNVHPHLLLVAFNALSIPWGEDCFPTQAPLHNYLRNWNNIEVKTWVENWRRRYANEMKLSIGAKKIQIFFSKYISIFNFSWLHHQSLNFWIHHK